MMFPSGLYGICDDSFRTDLDLVEQSLALLQGGTRVIQLRAKRTAVRPLVRQIRGAVEACHRHGAICLVNDRVDLALVAEADGVHLGDEDLAPADARRVLPRDALVGVTVRDEEGARAAASAGADYLGVGPLFATRTKLVPAPVLGLRRFAEVVRGSVLPVVGIGGVNLANITQVAATGAHGAAVLSDLIGASDVPARARALRAEFERGRQS